MPKFPRLLRNECGNAGLPEPEFKEEFGGFAVYFYKDIYTEANLGKMELNERQIKAVMFVKERGKITNKEYQEINSVSKKTASRDLNSLVKNEIFIQQGITGKGTLYNLKRVKGVTKGSQRGQTDIKGVPKE